MKPERLPSIDQFRGLAILSMVLANYMGGVQLIPAWLKHAPDIGLTVIDLVAPFFIFAIALTYRRSFQRRLEGDGAPKAYRQFFTRYLAIAGLGTLLSAGETALGINTSGVDWGVLQAIGVAGLLTLAVIRLRPMYRWLIGAGILVIYQLILDHFTLGLTLRSPHGGLFGSLNWAAMLILGTALADLFHDQERGRRLFPWVSLGLLALGGGLGWFLPVSKNRVSSTYVLISLGLSALLFLAFYLLSARLVWQGGLLVTWGKNPLALYFLHFIILGLFYLPGIPAIYSEAPLWLVLIEMAILIGGISLAAGWLERRNIIFTL